MGAFVVSVMRSERAGEIYVALLFGLMGYNDFTSRLSYQTSKGPILAVRGLSCIWRHDGSRVAVGGWTKLPTVLVVPILVVRL